jgi:hypothetical protein
MHASALGFAYPMASIPKRHRAGQRVPKTLAQYHAKPERSQVAIDNLAHVITRMREGASLTRASAEYGVDRRTVIRLGGSALRKDKAGRYKAAASDNLLRVLVVPVHGGREEFAVRGSRAASMISEQSRAQGHFLATGDDSKLRKLRGKRIKDASGREIPFLTDLDELERLGDAGVLQFESIYARRA